MNMCFKVDSICCIKFNSCNKNIIKLLFVRPFMTWSRFILFYLKTSYRTALNFFCLTLPKSRKIKMNFFPFVAERASWRNLGQNQMSLKHFFSFLFFYFNGTMLELSYLKIVTNRNHHHRIFHPFFFGYTPFLSVGWKSN